MTKNTQTAFKATTFAIVTLFIALLLIKRFAYFNPCSHFVETRERYLDVHHRNLHGWFLENHTTDRVVLFCHGNTGNVSNCEETTRKLRDLGMSVLVFDYSGFGRSKGVPSEQQLYDDASAMMALLQKRYETKNLVVYGESIGGSVASYVALKHGIPYLVLNCPLPSIKSFVQHKYPYLSWFGFLFGEFDTAQFLAFYKGETLLMYSQDDEIISPTSMAHLTSLSTKHIVIGGGHLASNFPMEEISRFLLL